MNKKTLRIVFAVFCMLLMITGIILHFVLKRPILLTPIALSLVGLLISREYQGEERRTFIRVLQTLAVLIIFITPLCWFAFVPHALNLTVNIAALAINVPLAFVGFSKK